MSDPERDPTVLRLSGLPRNRPHEVALVPDGPARAAIARRLGLDGLRKLRMDATLEAAGKRDWRLAARLGATVVQPCVVTAVPVTTRIDADIARHYAADFQPPTETDAEMPEDDTEEALPETLDLTAVMTEALALEVPLYPRAPDAELGEAVFAPPGTAPMRDEETKPFAGLAALRDKLGGQQGPDDDDADGNRS